jgi:site-specific DNA recombinase
VTTKPWLTYARVSTDDQAREGVSLDAQRASCGHLAAASGYVVSEAIVDPGYSAKDLKRPGMQKLLAQVDAGEVAGVIIYKLDRLTRSQRDLLDLLARFDKAGVALVSVTERLDTGSPMGRFVIGLIGLVAEWERETIAERVQTGMDHRRAQGGYIGGRPPAGLRAVGAPGKRMLVVDERTGPSIAKVWGMVAAGGTLREVARYLNSGGVPMRGKGWTVNNVHQIIRNSKYVGLLVSADDQAHALKALGGRGCPSRPVAGVQRGPRARAMRVWMLTGIARCQCGAALVGVSAHGGSGHVYHYYRCNNRIRRGKERCRQKDLSAERWEPAVIEALVALVMNDNRIAEAIGQLQAQAQAQAGPLQEERDRLVLQRDRLQAEVGRLVELAATGGLASTAVAVSLADRQRQIEALQVRIAGLDGQLAVAHITQAELGNLIEQLRGQLADLPHRPVEDQAAALRLLVREAVLRPGAGNDSGEVDLSINLPAPGASSYQVPVWWSKAGTHTNALRFRVAVRTGLRRAG